VTTFNVSSPIAHGSLGNAQQADTRDDGPTALGDVVYDRCGQVGGKQALDDLAETAIGDWKMPDFRTGCAYAATQGWLIVRDDTPTLTMAGLAAA
jgi:hypothetical protein